VLLLVSLVAGNEWSTSRNQHCIERCTLREKIGRKAYVCHTVDGVNKEFRPSNGTNSVSGRPSFDGPIPSFDDDDEPWDFCTPAAAVGLETDKTGETPEPEEIEQGQGGFNPGNNDQVNFPDRNGGNGGGFNAGASATQTSLENIACSGPCKKNNNGAYMCNYGGADDQFYCSPDLPLKRDQITSHNKVYCIDRCENTNTGDHMCRTMFGKDHCSPSRGFSTKQTKCQSPCTIHPDAGHNYLSCRIDENTYEQCGDWEIQANNIKALEYTQDGEICAGPCKNNGGEMVCSFAEWREQESEADPKSILYMMEGDCGPEAGMNWTLIGIILGSVVGAVLIIAVIGIVVSRRSGYNRAATRDI